MNGKKVTGEAEFPDGHKGKALENGQCAICTECKPIRGRFNDELKANPDLDAKLKQLEDRLKTAPDIEKPGIISQQKAIHDKLLDIQKENLGPKVKDFEKRLNDPTEKGKITKAEWDDYYRSKRKLDKIDSIKNRALDEQTRQIGSRIKDFEDRLADPSQRGKISVKEWENYYRDKRQFKQNFEKIKQRYQTDTGGKGTLTDEKIKQYLEEGKVYNPNSKRFGVQDGKSLREQYMGSTPGKNSRTGREVFDRMMKENPKKARILPPDRKQFLASDGKWYDLKFADMGHIHDAVTYWNNIGRFLGPKHPEVRNWMLNSKNYELQHFSYNRSAGAKLGASVSYLPPVY